MKKFYDIIYRIFMTFCQCVFVVSIVVTSYVVFARYILHFTPRWGEQLILLCMVYMTMISASLAVRKDTHIRVTLMDFIFPKPFVTFLKYFAHIGISAFSLFMIFSGVQFCSLMTKSVLSGLPIKQAYLYAAVPLAGVAMLIMESEKYILFYLTLTGKPLPEGYTEQFSVLTDRDERDARRQKEAEEASAAEVARITAEREAAKKTGAQAAGQASETAEASSAQETTNKGGEA